MVQNLLYKGGIISPTITYIYAPPFVGGEWNIYISTMAYAYPSIGGGP